jgi:hypothetical protein
VENIGASRLYKRLGYSIADEYTGNCEGDGLSVSTGCVKSWDNSLAMTAKRRTHGETRGNFQSGASDN